MITYESDSLVTRPPDEVFDAVVDIARWGEWTDMRDIRPDGPAGAAIGSTGTFTLPGSPFRGPLRYEVTTFDPGRTVGYRITHPALEWLAEVGVEPVDGQSRLFTRGSMRLKGLRRLLEPMIAREVRSAEAGELMRLKGVLESGAGVAAPRAPVGSTGTPRS